MHRCAKCQRNLPADQFRPNPKLRSGLNSWCKPCTVAATREWRERNRDEILARRRATRPRKPQVEGDCAECGAHFIAFRSWQRYCSRECKRTASWRRGSRRSNRVGIGSRARKRILDRDHWMCYLCKRAIDPALVWPHPLSPSVDHVIPVSAGGSNRYANLRATHWHCNEAKGDSLPGTEVWVPLEAA